MIIFGGTTTHFRIEHDHLFFHLTKSFDRLLQLVHPLSRVYFLHEIEVLNHRVYLQLHITRILLRLLIITSTALKSLSYFDLHTINIFLQIFDLIDLTLQIRQISQRLGIYHLADFVGHFLEIWRLNQLNFQIKFVNQILQHRYFTFKLPSYLILMVLIIVIFCHYFLLFIAYY